MKVHAAQLAERRRRDKQIKRHGLVDVAPAIGRHVDQCLHAELIGCLVQLFEIVRDVEFLDGPFGRNELVLQGRRPQAALQEIVEQVLVDDRERPGKRRPAVEIARDGLERFGIAEDLRGRRRRHGSDRERVADAV